MKQLKASVISSQEVMPGVYLIWPQCPAIASAARPGQFVMVKCGNDNLLRRPFSIHQVSDDKSRFALLYSVVGRGTQWLSKCKPGDELDVLGPLGNGFTILPEARNILLVGGGIGIAPIYFLGSYAIKKGIKITLGIGTSKGVSLLPLHNMVIKLRDLCKNNKPLVKIHPFSEDGAHGVKGLVTSLCESCADEVDQVFACGPTPMYHTMAKMPQLKGKPVQVSLEVRMGCGFGLCYGCTIKTKQGLKQICKDGPVFEMNDIIWDEFAEI